MDTGALNGQAARSTKREASRVRRRDAAATSRKKTVWTRGSGVRSRTYGGMRSRRRLRQRLRGRLNRTRRRWLRQRLRGRLNRTRRRGLMVVAPVVAVVRTMVVPATCKRRRNREYGQCNGKLFHQHSLLFVLSAVIIAKHNGSRKWQKARPGPADLRSSSTAGRSYVARAPEDGGTAARRVKEKRAPDGARFTARRECRAAMSGITPRLRQCRRRRSRS